MRFLLLLTMLGCGTSISRSLPASTAARAGAAAAIAGAAALAEPDRTAREAADAAEPDHERRPQKPKVMPAEVLDHLDEVPLEEESVEEHR